MIKLKLTAFCLLLCFVGLNAQTQQLNLKSSVNQDDAEEITSAGTMYLTSSPLELGGYYGAYDVACGVRFPNVTIPSTGVIIESYIQFTTQIADTQEANITIKAQQGNASTYTAANSNITNRNYTDSSVLWNPPVWSTVGARGLAQRTGDLTQIIEEARSSNFNSGNALAFKFTSSENLGQKWAYGRESGLVNTPELVIKYSPTPIPQTVLADVLVINEVTGSGTSQNRNDWVELYNSSNEVISLEGISISDKLDDPFKLVIENQYIDAQSFKLFETDDFFGIKTSGETIYLFQTINGNTVLIDTLEGRPTIFDTSYGRLPNGSSNIVNFNVSTPGNSNNNAQEFIALSFSRERGVHTSGFGLTLSAEQGASIRYTTNGSAPTRNSGTFYNGPINIYNNTVVKAIAYSSTGESKVTTHTYVISNDPAYQQIPIGAITTTTAIGSTIENTCTFEYIDKYGENSSTSIEAGFKAFGNVSLGELKKNFRVYFKSQYGDNKLRHDVFQQEPGSDIEPANSFKALDFKTGQDATYSYQLGGTMMSEVIARKYSRQLGNAAEVHAQYAHLFFNGQYHGVYALRERFNANWMQDYYGGEDDEYDIYNSPDTVNEFIDTPVVNSGTIDSWNFLRANSRTNFQALKTALNVDQFIDFMLLYFVGDFESEWRANTHRDLDRAKLQFYHNDLDGFIRANTNVGLSSHKLKLDITSGHGPGELFWLANMGGRNLEYETMVKDRVLTVFDEDPSVGILSVYALTQATVNQREHFRTFNSLEYSRWGYSNSTEYESRINDYLAYLPTRITDVLDFLNSRQLVHNYDYVNYSEPEGDISANTQVTIQNPNPGTVVYYSLNGEDVVFDNAPSGILYNQGTPLPLVEGYNVVKSRAYSNGNFGPIKEIVYNVKSSLNITGINYKPTVQDPLDEEDFEFVLLTNNGDEARDVAGYYFDGFNFEFPEGAIIGAGETVMIVKNLQTYPAFTYSKFLWTEGGKLKNSGEELVLFTDNGRVINQLTFDDENPWPEAADGNGSFLKLIENDFDNTIPTNWIAEPLPALFNSLSAAEDFIIENQVSIFPVPVNDILNISLKKMHNNITASIYDVSGKRLMQVNETNKQDLKIDISNFSAGVYILMLDINNTRVLRKVLKN